MILTCPACGTQYVVKDGAIPPGGRQVRCAACRHSWHQDADESADDGTLAEAGEPGPVEAPLTDETPSPDQGDDDGGPEPDEYRADASAEEPAWQSPAEPEEPLAEVPMAAPIPPDEEDADSIEAAPPQDVEGTLEQRPYEPVGTEAEDDFSPFAARDYPEERRRSPLVTVLTVILLVAALAAAFWFLAPAEWKQRIGLASAGDTPLQLMMTHSDRQRLASGNELLAISGRVINPTDEQQKVPPITAQLHDAAGKLVYSWTIAPPAPSLGPGASASFNSAEVNVPAGGDELTVTLGSPKA